MAICTEFQKSFPSVNLKFKKEDEKGYDYTLLLLLLGEMNIGFKARRVNKTTSKGTKVSYERIKDTEDLEEYKRYLQKEVDGFKQKWGTSLYLGGD